MIEPKDTPEILEKRILELEHLAYPEAIQLVSDERVRLDSSGKACYIDRYSRNWDVEWEELRSGDFRLKNWKALDETRSRAGARIFADRTPPFGWSSRD